MVVDLGFKLSPLFPVPPPLPTPLLVTVLHVYRFLDLLTHYQVKKWLHKEALLPGSEIMGEVATGEGTVHTANRVRYCTPHDIFVPNKVVVVLLLVVVCSGSTGAASIFRLVVEPYPWRRRWS